MFAWFKRMMKNARQVEPQAGSVGVNIWPRSDSGVPVTHESALKFSAVWACVRVISEAISQMEWSEYAQTPDGKRRINGPLDVLLSRRPNNEMSAFSFRETMLAHALTWGNGYAEIERDSAGRPLALWPLPPDRVQVHRDEDGQIQYVIQNREALQPSQVFHVRGLGYDGLVGYSVISMTAQSIGLGMVQERAGAAFWRNGARPGGILTPDGTMNREARKQLEEEWNAAYGGGANMNKIVALSHSLKYTPISIPNEDAQFLDSRKFSVDDIARWYRVPPHKIGSLDRATFSNIEHQAIEFVTDTLVPWAMRLEQEADIKLLPTGNRIRFTKLSVNSLMRGDAASRAEFYAKMRDLGALSVNDILESEDRNTIGEDGDVRLVPLNMVPLDAVARPAEAETPPPEPESEPEEQPESNAMAQALHAAVGRIAKRECNQLSRYFGKSTFGNRVDTFYEKHRQYVQQELQPLVALAGGMLPHDWAGRYCDQQRQCIGQCRTASDADRLWQTWASDTWIDRQTAAVMRAAEQQEAVV